MSENLHRYCQGWCCQEASIFLYAYAWATQVHCHSLQWYCPSWPGCYLKSWGALGVLLAIMLERDVKVDGGTDTYSKLLLHRTLRLYAFLKSPYSCPFEGRVRRGRFDGDRNNKSDAKPMSTKIDKKKLSFNIPFTFLFFLPTTPIFTSSHFTLPASFPPHGAPPSLPPSCPHLNPSSMALTSQVRMSASLTPP